jgi:hypothetical protein
VLNCAVHISKKQELLVRTESSAETHHQPEREQIGEDSFLILYKRLSMSIAIHTVFKDLMVQCVEGKGTAKEAKEQPRRFVPTRTPILKKMLIQ